MRRVKHENFLEYNVHCIAFLSTLLYNFYGLMVVLGSSLGKKNWYFRNEIKPGKPEQSAVGDMAATKQKFRPPNCP